VWPRFPRRAVWYRSGFRLADLFAAVRDVATPVTHAQDVAEAVWHAVTDPAAPMRIPAGADALALARGQALA
jgi:hypothetical protein